MTITLSCVCAHKMILIYGESVLPKVKEKMDQRPYKTAVKYMGYSSTYNGFVDFITIKIFPEYRNHCLRYYRDGKENLSDITTEEERDKMEETILLAMDSVLILYRQKQKREWARISRVCRSITMG